MNPTSMKVYFPYPCDLCGRERVFHTIVSGWVWVDDPENTSLSVSLCPGCSAKPNWREVLAAKRRHYARLAKRRRDERQRERKALAILAAAAAR